ncbi:MAG: hypothetical protein H6699_00020 [Myxococcales bacterium]|nr:hypothetical protein [Myxococcales bacterium]
MTPRAKTPLDDLALAERLALGEQQTVAAERFDTNQVTVSRRVASWRREIANELKESKPRRAFWWLDEASAVQVAGRWLFLKTGDAKWQRYAVFDSES